MILFLLVLKNCDEIEFKKALSSRGINSENDIRNAMLACKIIDAMLSKMDINLHPRHFIEMVITVVKENKKIPKLEAYYTEKIKEIKIKRKLSNNKIKRLEQSKKFTNKNSKVIL